MMKKIIIFGAGQYGMLAYELLRHVCEVAAFCDNDVKKQKQGFLGLPVIAPGVLCHHDDASVVVASSYHFSIARQLFLLGIKRFILFSYMTRKQAVFKIDLTGYDNVETVPNKVILYADPVPLASGSNCLALWKLLPRLQTNLQFVPVNLAREELADRYYDLLTAKALVLTQVPRPELRHWHVLFQTWHGFGFKSMGYLERGMMPASRENFRKGWNAATLTFTSCGMERLMFSASALLPLSKMRDAGHPHNDFLFEPGARERLAKLTGRFIPSKVIFYLPTYRTDSAYKAEGSLGGLLQGFMDFDLDRFSSFLAENDLLLVVKFHPNEVVDTALYEGHPNIYVLTEELMRQKDMLLYEVLAAADIGISDFSSVYTDILLLERPFIFLDADLPEILGNRGIMNQPYDFWAAGPKVHTMEALMREIGRFLADEAYYRAERRLVNRLMHTYIDGHSAQRVVDAIAETLQAERGGAAAEVV